jgi:hypothetical protein
MAVFVCGNRSVFPESSGLVDEYEAEDGSGSAGSDDGVDEKETA